MPATLLIDGKTYKLSLLPSGVVRGKLSIIGNGVVIDPWALMEEIDTVREQGVDVTAETLRIAENATIILPLHGALDRARNWRAAIVRSVPPGAGSAPPMKIRWRGGRSGSATWRIPPACRKKSTICCLIITRCCADLVPMKSTVQRHSTSCGEITPSLPQIRGAGLAVSRRSKPGCKTYSF